MQSAYFPLYFAGIFVTVSVPLPPVPGFEPVVNVPGPEAVVLSVHVIVPFSAVRLVPDTVAVNVAEAFDGLRVNTPPETLFTVPALFFVPAVSSYSYHGK